MKQVIAILLAIFTTLSCGWASLGQDYDRIDDAYDSIMERRLRDDGTVSILYKKDRYLYLVIFANGRSVSETYFHVKGTALSEKEIKRFLKANAAGATWTEANTSNERRFRRSDGKAEATYGNVKDRPALTVREIKAERGSRDE
jgi:hypothetical protein